MPIKVLLHLFLVRRGSQGNVLVLGEKENEDMLTGWALLIDLGIQADHKKTSGAGFYGRAKRD